MRLAIVGSRHFKNYDLLRRTVDDYQLSHGPISVIISGGADGADSLAESYAWECNIATIIYPALWSQHGRAAGPIRNSQIASECTECIAFLSIDSVGTRDTIVKVKKLGKGLLIIRV